MGKRIPVLLDGDPGHDDAIAWMLAGSSGLLNIRGITTICGNQTIEKTTYNALRIGTLLGLKVPIAKGRSTPLMRELTVAANVHGQTGLDGAQLPEPTITLLPLNAVSFMAKVLHESQEPITIVATGPLTNVAALLLAHPELKPKIAAIYLMGGGIQSGNWTPAAEFNMFVDPDAADIVFRSGLPITMAGLDVTRKALVLPKDTHRIRLLGTPVALAVAGWLDFFYCFYKAHGYAGSPIHDGVAVVALIAPQILTMRDMYVAVETGGDYCRGATVGDWYGDSGEPPNARVILDIDREAFVELLMTAIKSYEEVAQ